MLAGAKRLTSSCLGIIPVSWDIWATDTETRTNNKTKDEDNTPTTDRQRPMCVMFVPAGVAPEHRQGRQNAETRTTRTKVSGLPLAWTLTCSSVSHSGGRGCCLWVEASGVDRPDQPEIRSCIHASCALVLATHRDSDDKSPKSVATAAARSSHSRRLLRLPSGCHRVDPLYVEQ